MAGFADIAAEKFSFLEERYGFIRELSREEDWGGQVQYRNQQHGIAIKLVYEFASAFTFVFIYRLVNGKLVDNALPISEESKITCFDFNDLLDETQKMRPAYEYGEDSPFYDEKNGLRNFVAEFAKRLRTFGDKVLRGDFSDLPKVEKIIKARAKENDLRSRSH